MRKRYKLNLVRAKRSYSVKETAQLLKVHVRTVQSWRKSGLSALEGSRPALIMGYELKQFLIEELQKQKHPLEPGEFYCVRCRCAVRAMKEEPSRMVRRMGRNKIGVMARGVCAVCKGTVVRFGAIQASTRIDEVTKDTPLNVAQPDPDSRPKNWKVV